MKRLTLRQARMRAKLTQDELAKAAQVDQTTISAIECGRRTNPSFDTATRLAKALGIAPSRLRFSEPDPDGVSVAAGNDKEGQPRSRGGAAA